MSTREIVLFLHLLGGIGFFAGMAVAATALAAARRRERSREIALLLGLTRVGVLLVVAGALIALIFGIWLLELTPYGFGDGWISASLGLLVLATVLGALGGQRPKRARLLAERSDAPDEPAPVEVKQLLGDPLSLVLNIAAAAAGVAILLLMVWRPGAG